jgi:tetratricopeptide (TPR) repeat protein
MRAVMHDPALMKHARQFVWLYIDVDVPANAGFLARHMESADALPALYVIDPVTERVRLAWLGTATAKQLTELLDEGAGRTARGADRLAEAPAERAMTRGHELLGDGKANQAAESFREALAQPGLSPASRVRALEVLAGSLLIAGRFQECASLARAEAGQVPPGPSFANLVLNGLYAVDLAGEQPWSRDALDELVPLARKALAIPDLTPHDRAAVYGMLFLLLKRSGDRAGASRMGEEWLAFFDRAAPAATEPDDRLALDILRMHAARQVGVPARALAGLEASARAMPDDYSALLYLALTYSAAGHLDEALATCDRAMSRSPGRIGRARILHARGSILLAKGNRDAALETLEAAARILASVDPPSLRQKYLAPIDSQLQELRRAERRDR